MCKIDGELELDSVSCDKVISRGGMRMDGETSQSKDSGDFVKRESQYSRLSNDGVAFRMLLRRWKVTTKVSQVLHSRMARVFASLLRRCTLSQD
jgi:hypothetical protein